MGDGYGWYLIQMLLALAAVCAAAYLVLRFVVRRAMPTGRRGPVRVVARVPVEPKRSLLVVDVADRTFLLGSAESGLTLIAELDPAKMPQEARGAPPT